MPPPRITLNHIAIAVPNLDAALAFYRDALGIPLDHIDDVEVEGVRVAFLPLAINPNHPPKIELVTPTREGTGIAKWLAKNAAGGLHHMCVEVDDIDAAITRAMAHGAQMINATPLTRSNGTHYAFIHPKSAFGVLVELYQYP